MGPIAGLDLLVGLHDSYLKRVTLFFTTVAEETFAGLDGPLSEPRRRWQLPAERSTGRLGLGSITEAQSLAFCECYYQSWFLSILRLQV
jgi:hypothetical protein